jgi:parallel beta-helix repeat protein
MVEHPLRVIENDRDDGDASKYVEGFISLPIRECGEASRGPGLNEADVFFSGNGTADTLAKVHRKPAPASIAHAITRARRPQTLVKQIENIEEPRRDCLRFRATNLRLELRAHSKIEGRVLMLRKHLFPLALVTAAAAAATSCRFALPNSSAVTPPAPALPAGPAQAQFPCGATISESASLAGDLNCPATTGFALNVLGSGITLDGNGHQIVAPNAAAGLFVHGENVTIKNLTVNGVSGGDGILAADAPGVTITGNSVSGNQQGIVLYAGNSSMTGAVIANNHAAGNLQFGVRTGFDFPGQLVLPRIYANDLSNSGSYGLLLKATSFDLGGDPANTYANSLNGIYLAGGTGAVHGLQLTNDRIQRISIFADSLDSLTVTGVDASTRVPGDSKQERIGMDLYRVAKFSVSGFDGSANDVGLKLETELGVNPAGTVTASQFAGNTVSGILEVSYDGTPYGVLDFTRNCYAENAPVLRNYLVPGTAVGADSVLDDGLNVCQGIQDR